MLLVDWNTSSFTHLNHSFDLAAGERWSDGRTNVLPLLVLGDGQHLAEILYVDNTTEILGKKKKRTQFRKFPVKFIKNIGRTRRLTK